MAKRSASSARVARTAKSERSTRRIDYSDIPAANEAQLRSMRRVGRPTLGASARQLIAIGLDVEVLKSLRKEAARRNLGYQTLVNRVLAAYVRRQVA